MLFVVVVIVGCCSSSLIFICCNVACTTHARHNLKKDDDATDAMPCKQCPTTMTTTMMQMIFRKPNICPQSTQAQAQALQHRFFFISNGICGIRCLHNGMRLKWFQSACCPLVRKRQRLVIEWKRNKPNHINDDFVIAAACCLPLLLCCCCYYYVCAFRWSRHAAVESETYINILKYLLNCQKICWFLAVGFSSLAYNSIGFFLFFFLSLSLSLSVCVS